MKTIVKNTKPPAPAQTLEINIPPEASRLAYQLGTTPEKIIQHVFRIGLRNIDWNLANDAPPFADGASTDEFNITAAMNRLSPKRFAALCEGDEMPQKVLLESFFSRKWERRHAEKVVPLYGGAPMIVE